MFLIPLKLAAVALAAGLAGSLPAAAKKPADVTSVAPAKPDWSGFATVGDVVGEVVKVDDAGFTLRVDWSAQNGHHTHGTVARTPQQLAQHLRQMESQFARMERRSGKKGRDHHRDYQLTFADAGLVRWKALPAKTDEAGKKVPYTDEELKALRQPAGAVGYAADRSDLKIGQVVEATLVRPKTVPADKATLSDLRVKSAVILGTDPRPAAANNKKAK